MTKFEKSVIKVYEELKAMPKDELKKKLAKHKNSWAAKMLMETGAINLFIEDLKRRK